MAGIDNFQELLFQQHLKMCSFCNFFSRIWRITSARPARSRTPTPTRRGPATASSSSPTVAGWSTPSTTRTTSSWTGRSWRSAQRATTSRDRGLAVDPDRLTRGLAVVLVRAVVPVNAGATVTSKLTFVSSVYRNLFVEKNRMLMFSPKKLNRDLLHYFVI